MSLVHNERTKLTATWLNGIAIASVAVGGIAPLATVVTGTVTASLAAIATSSIIWLLIGAALHFAARAVLGRLKE